ncbi:MAG: methyltransferase, TIGR04325 family [Burkholderiales bacterium]
MPPALIERLKPLLRTGIYFTGNYPDWESASTHASGYDSGLILERVRQALLQVKSGAAVFERDSVLFDEVQHSFPVLAGLLRAAAENGQRLSVLDFGGSLGSSYFQCIDFLRVLSQVSWNVVEQAHFVRCGREDFESPQLRFFHTMAECLERASPNVALLSSVLQYVAAPYQVLDDLAAAGIAYILIDRTPFSGLGEDRIAVQHVPASIYAASYPCRIFAARPFWQRFGGNYEVIARFDSIDGSAVADGVEFSFGGAILRKK